MEDQTVMSNDRMRTHWTPLMERYFIDLLLEHLKNGNNVGHTFKRQAWIEMQTMFNAKFGTHYHEKVLKTRYANLWKQFNDVKTILSHIDFYWDASRQMVVAMDESAWDAYIKAYPDVECYRTIPVLSFDDLSDIYSHSIADGRYSLSSHDETFSNEESDDQQMVGNIGPYSSPRINWTPAKDQLLVELLVDQLGQGNELVNDDDELDKKVWTDMVAMFNAKFDCKYARWVLRRRFKKLLKYYCDITNILKAQGFSLDTQQQMLLANDSVWGAYIKEYPYARWYRSKTFPKYCDLELLFKNSSVDEFSHLHEETNHEDVASEVNADDRKGKRNASVVCRTYWTPSMSRCLVDLLLEQVKNGNKSGQSLMIRAWDNVLVSFNERFKSGSDRDVLRSHYKSLKKRFNIVNHLLQQNGFSWDDTREMVVAEGHLWDAIIKELPEARPLKSKPLFGYRKLCVIFGEESFGERCLSHNVDPIVESPMLPTGGQKDGNFPSVHVAASTIESLESYFIDHMVEQVNRGNVIGNSFNEEAWTHMVEALSRVLGVQCDKQFLEDRYFRLMKRHDNISSTLLNHNIFAWDENLQTILAEDEVWNSYIKDHPQAIMHKSRSLDHYNALCKIFGNKVTDAGSSAQGELQCVNAEDITSTMDIGNANFHVLSDVEISDQGTRRLKGKDIMDGTCGNLFVTGNTGMSSLNEQRQNGDDMVGFHENLDVSNTNISCQNTERPMEELDIMDGTYENLIVTDNTGMSYLNEQGGNEDDMVGFYENLDVFNTAISYQNTIKPWELDIDGTSENFVATGNGEILDQEKERENEMDMNEKSEDVVVIGNTVSQLDKKRPSEMPLESIPPKRT